MVVIHNQAPPGSLNNYETNWEMYDFPQSEDTKCHLGLKTGLQDHVRALPSLRRGELVSLTFMVWLTMRWCGRFWSVRTSMPSTFSSIGCWCYSRIDLKV